MVRQLRRCLAPRHPLAPPSRPHWYVVEDWQPEFQTEFMELVRRIFEEGVNEIWDAGSFTRSVRYYKRDGYKYWVMDPTIEQTDVVNRARM